MFFLIFIIIGCSNELERDRYAKEKNLLPVAAIPHLPEHGLILISNGYDRTPERIIVDLSGNKIDWIVPKEKTLSVWQKTAEKSKALDRGESHLLLKMWEEAYTEPPAVSQETKTERYDEILILVEGSKSRMVRSRGPITQEKSKSLIDTVRLYASDTHSSPQ